MPHPDNLIENTPSQSLTLLRLPAVSKRCGLSRSALYRMVSTGEFPKPVRISERSSAWVEHEVLAWIAARIVKRDSENRL